MSNEYEWKNKKKTHPFLIKVIPARNVGRSSVLTLHKISQPHTHFSLALCVVFIFFNVNRFVCLAIQFFFVPLIWIWFLGYADEAVIFACMVFFYVCRSFICCVLWLSAVRILCYSIQNRSDFKCKYTQLKDVCALRMCCVWPCFFSQCVLRSA